MGTAEEPSAGTHPLAVGSLLRLQNSFYLFFILLHPMCRTEPCALSSAQRVWFIIAQGEINLPGASLIPRRQSCSFVLLAARWGRGVDGGERLHFPVLCSQISALFSPAGQGSAVCTGPLGGGFLSHLLAGCPWVTLWVPPFPSSWENKQISRAWSEDRDVAEEEGER